MSAGAYTRDRVIRYELAADLIELLVQLEIRIWHAPPDHLRLACKPNQLTVSMQQRLAESKPELLELLRVRAAN